MFKEIGSDFWEYDIGKLNNDYWWENGYTYQYFKSGRNAIKALCRNLKNTNKIVLLPAYTCESVISPFVEEGWQIVFYDISENLDIDIVSLERMFDIAHPDVIFFHNYFGFDTISNTKDFLCRYKEQGCILVEDITSNFLSDNRTDFADYYISSFRKFFAIPDGGILISRNEHISMDVCEKHGELVKKAETAYEAKRFYFLEPSDEKKKIFKELFQGYHKEIDINDKLYAINPESVEIIKKLDIHKIKENRVRNYNFLHRELESNTRIIPVLGASSDKEVPLYFPIFVHDERSKLQSGLADNGIYCPIIWPKPEYVHIGTESTRKLYENMLCIPIDQRYGIEEMQRIVKILNTVLLKDI